MTRKEGIRRSLFCMHFPPTMVSYALFVASLFAEDFLFADKSMMWPSSLAIAYDFSQPREYFSIFLGISLNIFKIYFVG